MALELCSTNFIKSTIETSHTCSAANFKTSQGHARELVDARHLTHVLYMYPRFPLPAFISRSLDPEPITRLSHAQLWQPTAYINVSVISPRQNEK